ncbi:hypothetical protein K438DRAFT_1981095 [Mycena galopus ATCC 62051]|nr:hypothetical protein K438DRAFT_1981095 [Mycena galopus ATCC 62051]
MNPNSNSVWHYGNLTVDEDIWSEYYESERGPIDSKDNQEEYPQGYYWDCCGLRLNSAGCLKTEHAPLSVLHRNGRVLKELESERTTARWSSDIRDHARSHASQDSSDPPPSKKRKVDASVQIKCRNCGELYDEDKNTKRVCRWHDIDAVRRYTGRREGWSSDDGDEMFSENEGFEDEDEDVEAGRTIQWTCCGWNEKAGGGCIVTPHLPPKMIRPKVRG